MLYLILRLGINLISLQNKTKHFTIGLVMQVQIQEAKSGVKRALEAVEIAKASNDLKIASSPIVSESDEQINKAFLKLQSVSQAIETAVKDSKLVEEYRNLVEEGRQQFRTEIAALFPDTSPEGLAVKRGNSNIHYRIVVEINVHLEFRTDTFIDRFFTYFRTVERR